MVFANCQSPTGIDFAFPDVCKTLVGIVVVPLPYPNFGFRSMAIPSIYNQFTTCMIDQNLATIVPTTTGDEPGLLLGLLSNLIIGPSYHIFGSVKVFKTIFPATKMLSMTGQNGLIFNMVGVTLVPCQFKVLIVC